jgi:O-methyltransferase involved in polyketide biosynthesis
VSTEKFELAGAKETLLFTLYGRVLDDRSKASILGDHWASETLDRLGYNSLRMRASAGDRFLILLRAKRLDGWAREFLDRHPDAIVLHLGCGLDSRVFRIDPPAGVDWFDLDYPEVIDLRRRVYPERDHYRLIASSVTEPGWLDDIPADRPALVIAEGLLMYLTEADVKQLLRRLTGHFPYGEMAFDVVAPWVARLSNMSKLTNYALWPLRDPHEVERWNPVLTLIDDAPVLADYRQIPLRRYRIPYRLMNLHKAGRNFIRPLRYKWDALSGPSG